VTYTNLSSWRDKIITELFQQTHLQFATRRDEIRPNQHKFFTDIDNNIYKWYLKKKAVFPPDVDIDAVLMD
jgi:hypothetical protein